MYLVTQLHTNCIDAEHLLFYCNTLLEAHEIASDIAHETGIETHVLMLVATIEGNDDQASYAA